MADYMSIGASYTYFARMECNPQGSQRLIRDISVSGQNGVALRREEKRARIFHANTIVYVPTTIYVAEEAAELRQFYDETVGQVVTLGLQGVEYPNICVLSVQVKTHMPLVGVYFGLRPDGIEITADAYEVSAEWELVYAGAVT